MKNIKKKSIIISVILLLLSFTAYGNGLGYENKKIPHLNDELKACYNGQNCVLSSLSVQDLYILGSAYNVTLITLNSTEICLDDNCISSWDEVNVTNFLALGKPNQIPRTNSDSTNLAYSDGFTFNSGTMTITDNSNNTNGAVLEVYQNFTSTPSPSTPATINLMGNWESIVPTFGKTILGQIRTDLISNFYTFENAELIFSTITSGTLTEGFKFTPYGNMFNHKRQTALDFNVSSYNRTALFIDASSNNITFVDKYTFPVDDGTENQSLKTDGEGNLYWGNVTSTSGSSVSFGSDNQIPYTNAGGDDFDYDSDFTYSNGQLDVNNIYVKSFTPDMYFASYGFDNAYNPLSDDTTFEQYGYENFKSAEGYVRIVDTTPYSPSTGRYIYQVAPPIADYKVTIDVNNSWNSNNAAYGSVIARWQDDNNYYQLRYRIYREASGGGDFYLYNVVDGTSTLMASVDDGITHPDSGMKKGNLTLQVNGTNIKAFYDGVEKLNVNDSNHTSKGYAGFQVYDAWTEIANTGFGIDNFWINLLDPIGMVGTLNTNNWFTTWNDEFLEKYEDGAVRMTGGQSYIFEDSIGATSSSIHQTVADTLNIDSNAVKMQERFYVGSNPRLIFRAWDNTSALNRYEFDEGYDKFSLNPMWTEQSGGTEYFWEDTDYERLTCTGIYGTQEYNLYTYNAQPPHQNYTVQADFTNTFNANNAGYVGPLARFQDINNFYMCRETMIRDASGGPILHLIIKQGGTQTSLGSYDTGNEQNYRLANIAIQVVGDEVSCYYNGDKVISVVNGTFMDKGKAGIYMLSSTYDSYPVYADNFEIYPHNDTDYAYFGTQTPHDLKVFTSDEERWKFDSDTGDFVSKGNQHIILNTNMSEIYADKNLNFIVNTTANPDGVAWFSGNVSATGYITRTEVYDKEQGSALEKIQDADDMITDGKIVHSSYYGYTTYQVTDYDRPEVCYDKINRSYTCYPYTKTEEGVNIVKEIELLRQAVYELKLKNAELEEKLNTLILNEVKT